MSQNSSWLLYYGTGIHGSFCSNVGFNMFYRGCLYTVIQSVQKSGGAGLSVVVMVAGADQGFEKGGAQGGVGGSPPRFFWSIQGTFQRIWFKNGWVGAPCAPPPLDPDSVPYEVLKSFWMYTSGFFITVGIDYHNYVQTTIRNTICSIISEPNVFIMTVSLCVVNVYSVVWFYYVFQYKNMNNRSHNIKSKYVWCII